MIPVKKLELKLILVRNFDKMRQLDLEVIYESLSEADPPLASPTAATARLAPPASFILD